MLLIVEDLAAAMPTRRALCCRPWLHAALALLLSSAAAEALRLQDGLLNLQVTRPALPAAPSPNSSSDCSDRGRRQVTARSKLLQRPWCRVQP